MQSRWVLTVLSILILTAATHGAEPAKRTQYDPAFYAPSDKIVTPHIPWAKPYAQGKVKLLIICPRDAMREVVELSQRLSIDYAAVFTEGRNRLGESGTGPDASWKAIKGNSEEEIADSLRAKLTTKYDAIIIGNLEWSILPIDVRYEVLKAVKEGTGMLLVGVGKPDQYLPEVLKRKDHAAGEFLLSGFPVQALPAYEKYKDRKDLFQNAIKSARLGRGRILALPGGTQRHFLCPGKSSPDEPQTDYDYYLSLAIKAILWVAHKEPDITLTTDVPAGAQFDRKDLAAKGLDFTLLNSGPPKHVKLLCMVRNREGRSVWTDEARDVSLATGENKVKFTPPLLPAGTYFADLFASDWGKVVTWGSYLFEVTSPYFLTQIMLVKDAFAQAEPVRGKVLIGRCGSGQEIVVTQVDNWLRIVAEKHVPLKEGMATADFEIKPTAPPLTIIQNLQAKLIAGNDTLDAKKVEFSISDLYDSHDDFQFVMWASVYDNSFIDRSVWRICHDQYGCDTYYTGKPLMSALRENLRYIPYITRFVDTKTDWCRPKVTRMKGDLVRDPCLTDPKYRDETRQDLHTKSETCKKYSVHDVSLGDECLFVAGPWDLCFSPTCITDFQEYVKKMYGDLARLNAEYGTSYKTWTEVKPITLDEARKTHNPAQWVDHRRHMETVWATFHGYARQCIREVMPDAHVGHEGSNTEITSFQAGDFWQLMRNMDFDCIYLRPWTIHQLRDFGDPGIMTSYWYGGYEPDRNEPMQRRAPWFALFSGMNAQWEWFNYGGAGAVVAYDLTPYPFFEGAIEEIREIKTGIGKLIINSRRQHDGVAVLFSPASVHANTYAPVLENTRYENAFGAYLEVTKHIGINVRMIAYEELAQGKLNSGEFKVLMLPICQALSPPEVAEIQKFATNGGTVIADLKPGTCDEHGKLQKNALDDLFGVKVAAAGEKKFLGEVSLIPGKAATLPDLVQWNLPNTATDALTAVTTGEQLGHVGDVPAIIINKYGKGQGIYLNFSLAPYMTIASKRGRTAQDYEDGEPLRQLMRALLAKAGVKPLVTLHPQIASADIGRFTSGPAEYIGILQDLPEDPMKYTRKEERAPGARLYSVNFPHESHLYDVREHRYLGRTDKTLTSIAPARAKLFAMMPYRIDGVNISSNEEVRRGEILRYKIELQHGETQALAPHVVRLDVLDPDGKPVSCYSQNILLNNGSAQGSIHLAINDQPGQWRLKAREVVSAKETTLSVNVLKVD